MPLKPKVNKSPTKKGAVSTRLNTVLMQLFSVLSTDSVRLNPKPVDLVVGFSGGMDSMVLLHALAKLKTPLKGRIIAVHVHHNLSKNADAWASFCEKQAREFAVEFVLRKVRVGNTGEGVEAAARTARYRALEKVAQDQGALAIVTAHHMDDQIETFLIQWMRGAGPEGLSSMPTFRHSDTSLLVRPLLGFERSELADYAAKKHLKWVDDESNEDTAFLRNAVRKEVVPVLQKIRPGFKKAASRSIGLIAEATEILKEVAREDIQQVQEAGTGYLMLDDLLSLSAERQSRLLRQWLESCGLGKFPRTRIIEVLRQLKQTTSQSVQLLKANDKEFRLYGKRLMVLDRQDEQPEDEIEIRWNGQEKIALPQFNGELCFQESEDGFSEAYLKEEPLTVKRRSGGEKIKIHRLRPSKNLKALYQEAGIPEYERRNLPLVWKGKTLIYAAGIGEEIREKLDDDGGRRFSIMFRKTPNLI